MLEKIFPLKRPLVDNNNINRNKRKRIFNGSSAATGT